MEQLVDIQVDGNPDNVKEVMDFFNVDKTQRSDNPNNLFDVFEKPNDEHSLCTGYTDKMLDSQLDSLYADNPVNNLYFKSYRKNLFKLAAHISEKFPSCRFKLSWFEIIDGAENLFVVVVEKGCFLYYQKGLSYKFGPNLTQFLTENHLNNYVENHTRS